MKIIIIFAGLVLLNLPQIALAADYTPLVGIPGVGNSSDFDSYINALYIFSITIAALLAVIKIIIAGVKWMMTDVVTSKGEAKKDIQGALIGLLVVLAAVLILTVINPNLTSVNLSLNKAQKNTYAGAATNGAVHNSADVSTYSPTSDITIEVKPANASDEQKQLFVNECPLSSTQAPAHINGGSAKRCITHKPGRDVKPFLHCQTEGCSTPTENIKADCEGNNNGTYVIDPEFKNYGYCIW